MNLEITDIVLVVVAGLVSVSAVSIGLQPGGRRLGLAFLAAWLVPGLGHAMMGKRGKALFFAGAMAFLYVVGLALSGWRAILFADNPFYYVGQYGSGLTSFLGAVLGEPKAYPLDSVPKSWFDPGLLYVCVAGLLNLVVMLSILDLKPEEPAPTTADPVAPPAAPPEQGAA